MEEAEWQTFSIPSFAGQFSKCPATRGHRQIGTAALGAICEALTPGGPELSHQEPGHRET